MLMYDLILKKRDGGTLNKEEIQFFVDGVVNGTIPDYQISSMLMAIYFNGMTHKETAELTLAMEKSGDDVSKVEFELIWHTAYANHGSSGGALINVSLDLVGINFAVATNENGEYLYCVSVPSVKIAEFLTANGYSYSVAE